MTRSINVSRTLATAHDKTELVETKSGGFAVRERYDDPDTEDGYHYFDVEYDSPSDAALHFALWVKVNRFERPERSHTHFIPTKVATDGKPAIAAWLYLCGGLQAGSCAHVADRLDVTKETVRRYLSRVREEVLPRQQQTSDREASSPS